MSPIIGIPIYFSNPAPSFKGNFCLTLLYRYLFICLGK
jgi:hypothetical protein